MDIPSCKPHWSGREQELVRDALLNGWVSGDGYYTEQVSEFIRANFGAQEVLMTTSGTHALEMAAILADLQPGDEVIMPSFTFFCSSNAHSRDSTSFFFRSSSLLNLAILPFICYRLLEPEI